jgi:hypothetical protein
MISATNAKKKYMLTNDEIKNANLTDDNDDNDEEETGDIDLFFRKISSMRAYGTKYLVNDIEELAENIFANINNNDKRKQKYLKNIENNNEKAELIDNMRENVQVYLEEIDADADEDTLSFIEEVIKRKYDSNSTEVIGIIKRKIKLDNLIDEYGGSTFIEDAKKRREYSAYVYDRERTLRETFDKINKRFEGSNVLTARQEKIDKFIEENIDDRFINFVSNLEIYKKHVSQVSCKIKFETICKRLLEHVERKESLDNFVNDNIDDKYADFVHHLPAYNKYNSDLKCYDDFDTVCKIITEHVDDKIVSDKRKKLIKSKTGQWLRKAEWNSDVNIKYKTYLTQGGNVDATIRSIKKIIIEYDKSKTNDIDELINKIGFTDADLQYYEDVKFNFLTDLINLSDVKTRLIKIKKDLRK